MSERSANPGQAFASNWQLHLNQGKGKMILEKIS